MESIIKKRLPISYYQKFFWLEWKLDPASSKCNTSLVYRISGSLKEDALQKALNTYINEFHEAARCYFEETTEAKTSMQPAHYLANEHQSTRKEICTNFPYAQDKPFIRVGDQISLSSRDAKDGASYSALRKWKGNLYQMVSKTEMHLNQAVRFTLVTVRSGVNQWTVVDKF